MRARIEPAHVTPDDLAEWACDRCHAVYNPVIGDRYWTDLTVDGEDYALLCDDCRKELDADYTGDTTPATW